MVKKIDIVHNGMDYGVQLYNEEIVFYRVDIDSSRLARWGSEDDLVYNYSITGDVQNSVALYHKIAKAVVEIVYSENRNYYTFNVSDKKRQTIYKRFAENLGGYKLIHEGDYFYLYRQ